MTLAESKMTKMMKIVGTVGRCDLAGLWLKICIHDGVKCYHTNGQTKLEYVGELDKGLYVLKEVMEACEVARCNCRLEISHYYE